MSISDYGELAILNSIFNNVALQKSVRYVKLHIGDPGEAGTANAAAETTRKSLTGAAAASGTFTSVNALVWATVAATETYTHLSIWDHLTAGNCLWTGSLAISYAITAGQTFTIASGNLTVTVA